MCSRDNGGSDGDGGAADTDMGCEWIWSRQIEGCRKSRSIQIKSKFDKMLTMIGKGDDGGEGKRSDTCDD